MKPVQIEHALGMIRTYLVECVAHDDWSDQRMADLTELIRARISIVSRSGNVTVRLL